MSNMTLRDVLIALLPDGALWDLDEAGDFYKLLEGAGNNSEIVRQFLATLAYTREPLEIPVELLPDLEKEYGLLVNESLTIQERRDILHGVVYAPRSTGTAEYLQTQLQNAGFAVQVHVNSPAVDPGLFFGGAGGELITNNKLYDRSIFEARSVQGLWSYVFFIGGDAVRADNGALLTIAPVVISDELKSQFRELVLKYKPVHSWAIAVMNDADYFTFAPTDDAIIDAPRGFADDDMTTGGYWWAYENSSVSSFVIDDITYELITDDVSGEYLTEE